MTVSPDGAAGRPTSTRGIALVALAAAIAAIIVSFAIANAQGRTTGISVLVAAVAVVCSIVSVVAAAAARAWLTLAGTVVVLGFSLLFGFVVLLAEGLSDTDWSLF
jgi:hypothetical protein